MYLYNDEKDIYDSLVMQELLAMVEHTKPIKPKDYNDDFEEYSNNLDKNNSIVDLYDIGGHNNKRFVRYKSDKLKDLFTSIRKGSSYDTYINDLINNEENNPIEYVSVLRKVCQTFLSAVKEEFSSKIANYLGFKTVYNTYINKNESTCYFDVEPVILSVDFLRENETIVSLRDMGVIKWNNDSKMSSQENEYPSLSCCINVIKQALTLYKNGDIKNIDEIIEDFIMSYFIKFAVLGDLDFKPRNVSFIENAKTDEIKLAPNYDYEFCFTNNTDIVKQNLWKEIAYVFENYPQTGQKLYEKLKNIKSIDELKTNLTIPSEYEKKLANSYLEYVSERINCLQKSMDYFNQKLNHSP